MEKYRKYKTIHRISYIIFFFYLIILSIGNFDFGEYAAYVPYFIAVPFLIYCAIAIFAEIRIRKELRESSVEKKYNTFSKI
ncbi:MAG: hypothetical protein LBV71_13285 [Prevotella sp.]|jgi:c-di-AMP phosphodiesterase-like protein|nr:hypothetical protein [Prevotella sp.]